ncbi:kinase-like domain-containing protein [Suillus plorans]|uniref:Kinase-like domain-containing protein n=1 Tax=Suillus plorans TaxID=116603 RepID=A0A9P7AQ13_9AGAM|nr:kinase-like domain-containing protein [Suillus plorans]KAG1792982.1 kinase-like domain-containing protein [Suillus plorans]
MENVDVRTEDLPDDLTPFITRTALDHVGGGAFGDVWKCNYDANGISALVAVKAFRLPERYDLETLNRKISREIGILRILRHNNIVPLWGIATGFGRISELRCLVSPWIPNGTLNVYLVFNHNDLTPLDRSRMLEDVSAGLRYLHSISVMHGDITGANILIDEGGHARLIDFGLSTITQPLIDQSHLAATSIRPGAIRYAAPELVLPDNTRELPVPLEKADIYSFGCIMLQILSGRRPWSEISSEAFIIVSISHGRGPQRPDGQPTIIDSDWKFIQRCLQSEPELRPSADEVLDFVMHRLSSPDPCHGSGPPDDPSDDRPDNDPGASPHGGSNESDTVEQPPGSPSGRESKPSIWLKPRISYRHGGSFSTHSGTAPNNPDDTPDNDPGASLHGGSDDSDTAERPPDSPPLYPDDELKSLFTVADNLSASTSTAPAFSVPSFSHSSSKEISESSTTPGPVSYRPSDRSSL